MGIPRRTRVTLGADDGQGRGREFRLSRPVLLLLGGLMLVTWLVAGLLVAGVVRARSFEGRIATLERELAAARAEALAADALRAELAQARSLQKDLLRLLGLARVDSTGRVIADSLCDLPPGLVSVGPQVEDDLPYAGDEEFPDAAAAPADPGQAPSRWPAAGAIVRSFERGDPARGVEGHPGVDIAGAEGSKVVAAAEGLVDFVGEDEVLGKYVEIRHGQDWLTIYAHCASINVGPGHRVRAGEQVAKMGRTGQALSPQLHFQVWRQGVAVDPRQHISGEPAAR